MGKIKHPNIAVCKGLYLQGNEAISQVIEYSKKGTIQDLLQKYGRLGLFQVKTIAKDILQAMANLHILNISIQN